MFPSAITVYPEAQIQLNYFLQRDVVGDDPFTPQIEPSEPAVLGVLVTNVGQGAADNFSITTAQPQIINNQKGLAVNFQIIGTQVGTQQVTPSLTADFGNIAPGGTADAEFLLLSSLQGQFTNFTATYEHTDALGGTDTSLITSVTTHDLIHAVEAQYPTDDGEPDYLVDDTPNPQNLPDTLYLSNGTVAPVNLATNAATGSSRFRRRRERPVDGHHDQRLGLHPGRGPRAGVHVIQGGAQRWHADPGRPQRLDYG